MFERLREAIVRTRAREHDFLRDRGRGAQPRHACRAPRKLQAPSPPSQLDVKIEPVAGA
jgi:hypothetical protein